MPFSKDKAKRAEFVIREVYDLVKVINSRVDALEFIDRGDYEIVRIWYNNGCGTEIDITGASFAELSTAIIERCADYEEE